MKKPIPHSPSANCEHCARRFTNVICNSRFDTFSTINKEKECSFYRKGELIFKENARPYGVFCVNKGKIKLVKSGDDGREHILRLVKAGDPLGYRALLSGDRYNCSAVALEDCSVCFVPKEIFLKLIQEDGDLTMEMIKLLSSDLKKAEVSLTHLAQKPVRERMAEALLFIKETYGFEEDGLTINAVFSRDELANIVGTATETAIRLLSDFNKDKIIALQGKKIQILDIERLLRVANIND